MLYCLVDENGNKIQEFACFAGCQGSWHQTDDGKHAWFKAYSTREEAQEAQARIMKGFKKQTAVQEIEETSSSS